MAKKDYNKWLKVKLQEALDGINKRIESYEKVDATISNETLTEAIVYLRMADDVLEKGFVNDACKEIEDKMLN